MNADGHAVVGSLTTEEFGARLKGSGLGIRVGPLDLHLQIRVSGLAQPLRELYRDYPLIDDQRVFSCHATMHEVRSLRHGGARRVRLLVDGRAPHEDMPAQHALAVLEWGLNLVTAMRHQSYLTLHAAVVERGGRALLLPAAPGHGKTTLCAALAHRGWRLLSDEFGLLRPGSTQLLPVPRLMPLKNESIAVIRAFAPNALVGSEIAGTRKGTVAHVRPPGDSVARALESARVGWVAFPRWVAGASLIREPVAKAQAFMRLATNAFNYEMLGAPAFDTVRQLVQEAECFRLVYSDLAEAVDALTALADDRAA